MRKCTANCIGAAALGAVTLSSNAMVASFLGHDEDLNAVLCAFFVFSALTVVTNVIAVATFPRNKALALPGMFLFLLWFTANMWLCILAPVLLVLTRLQVTLLAANACVLTTLFASAFFYAIVPM
jgi:hypothetical protein